jgi:hypothetical protein
VPNEEPAGWDPYGNGYWANYPGWGYTWISGYSWGWLPYHCGAWNYWDSMGWGWVPGQCGLGWQPTVTIWNSPRGYRPPPRPIPGGHIGSPSRTLQAVNRGPALPGGGMGNHHTQPVRIEGHRVDPLPVLETPMPGGRLSDRATGTHTMPVGRSSGFTGNSGSTVRPVPPAATSGTRPPVNAAPRPVFRTMPPVQAARPVMPQPQRITPPAPRPMPPAPRMSTPPPRSYSPPPAPRSYSPPPAPHMSAPPASAGHVGSSGHH